MGHAARRRILLTSGERIRNKPWPLLRSWDYCSMPLVAASWAGGHHADLQVNPCGCSSETSPLLTQPLSVNGDNVATIGKLSR